MSPVVLVIRDGWGTNPNSPAHDSFNAVHLANIPYSKELSAKCPRTMLKTCGLDVGLPEGVMGNSEVGHQNIGAGRIVDQEIVRIDKAINQGSLKDNTVLQKAFECEKKGGALHLMGLASEVGVHGLIRHLVGLVKLAKEAGLTRVYIHAFTDGRDCAPDTGLGYIKDIEAQLAEIGLGQIATISGRFWAMDRAKKWDLVEPAYNVITGRKVEKTATCAVEAVKEYYANPLDDSRKGDEFIYPTQIVNEDGSPVATVKDGDAVIFYNFRGDRPRQITRAFINDEFTHFDRGAKLDIFYATMTAYESGLCPNVLFPKPPRMKNILGDVIAQNGLKQVRISETEKYPHVTFFFNDYYEPPFEGEDRKIIDSPAVDTYDQAPAMSAAGVTDAAVDAIKSKQYGLIVMNYPNGDMVGHTGSLEACIKAAEAVDAGLQKVLAAVDEVGGVAFVTADHGNCEQMKDPETGGAHTFHTLYDVEGLLYGAPEGFKLAERPDVRLADIAPTLLDLLGIEKPAEMTGRSLLIRP